MRIRMLQIPPVASVDGVALDCFHVGVEYEVGNSLGSLFLAEGWAVPVELDAPRRPEPFGPDDPFGLTTLDRNSPPNLVREQIPPFLDRDLAADLKWRRKPRR